MNGDQLLSSAAVRKRLGGVSDMTIWRWMDKGLLPAPLKINGRNYWRSSDIEKVAAGPVVDDPAPPVATRKGNAPPRTAMPNAGISLRDYFAAKAMAALIVVEGNNDAYTTSDIANEAYSFADHMLEKRGGAA
jgi:predicted DNA-binding transcriptional regulator AlpA